MPRERSAGGHRTHHDVPGGSEQTDERRHEQENARNGNVAARLACRAPRTHDLGLPLLPTKHRHAGSASCDEPETDRDHDGFCGNGDCNESDPNVNDGADDPLGDGIDQNCDGVDGYADGGAAGGSADASADG